MVENVRVAAVISLISRSSPEIHRVSGKISCALQISWYVTKHALSNKSGLFVLWQLSCCFRCVKIQHMFTVIDINRCVLTFIVTIKRTNCMHRVSYFVPFRPVSYGFWNTLSIQLMHFIVPFCLQMHFYIYTSTKAQSILIFSTRMRTVKRGLSIILLVRNCKTKIHTEGATAFSNTGLHPRYTSGHHYTLVSGGGRANTVQTDDAGSPKWLKGTALR